MALSSDSGGAPINAELTENVSPGGRDSFAASERQRKAEKGSEKGR